MLTGIIAGIIAAVVAVVVIGACIMFWQRSRGSAGQHSLHSGLGSKTHGSDYYVNELKTVNVRTGDGITEAGGKTEVTIKHSLTEEKSTGGLATRFTALGVFAGAVFATLSAKLLSMQVVSADEYASEAESNQYTETSIPAARGVIYDRNGVVLVSNKECQTVLADPDVAEDEDVIKRLSAVLGLPVGVVRQRLADTTSGAQGQRTIASDARLRDVAFISEHSDAFSGVSVESRTVREYPYGALCAHVLGYTGYPTEEDLEYVEEGRDIESTDTIGKSGVESYYDSLLSGDKGIRTVRVDAEGNVVAVVGETSPSAGSDLYLTIDAHAQYVADAALASTIAPKGDIGTGTGVTSAIVALDITDGSVVVMASYPTFDPSGFTGGIPQETWDLYNTEESHSPLLNRAINGQFAAASTFKPFTSMASMNYGFASPEAEWTCTGRWTGFGVDDAKYCWDHSGHGTLGLHRAIVVSCDVPFYEMGKAFFDHGPEGTGELSETALQDFYKLYGFGSATGIDLDGESSGVVPTPEWKAETWANVPSEGVWKGGDYTNIVIGQGDILVTPLQLACAYCSIATGKTMKPHLLKEVKNASGDTVLEFSPELSIEPDVNADNLKFVQEALVDVIADSSTLSSAFASITNPAGKSGTAEHTDKGDDGWFVAYAPYDNPKYVAACVIEQANSGGSYTAPIVSSVLAALFESDGTEGATVGYISGSSGKSTESGTTSGAGRTD